MPQQKTIGILQPVYLPWLGYFEQMASVDHFVFMDDAQYTRHDWRNRNRIKTARGAIWLTVPIKKKHALRKRIREIEIDYERAWQKKHLKSIALNYKKCPYFQPLFSELEQELRAAPQKLQDLDYRLIHLLCKYLVIDTPTSFSSEIPWSQQELRSSVSGGYDKNQRVIDICLYFGASLFYEGAKGAEYIDVERFRRAGIEVVFQDYLHPIHRQAFGAFLSHQSAIDLIMNTGPEAPAILRSSPLPPKLQRSTSSPRIGRVSSAGG